MSSAARHCHDCCRNFCFTFLDREKSKIRRNFWKASQQWAFWECWEIPSRYWLAKTCTLGNFHSHKTYTTFPSNLYEPFYGYSQTNSGSVSIVSKLSLQKQLILSIGVLSPWATLKLFWLLSLHLPFLALQASQLSHIYSPLPLPLPLFLSPVLRQHTRATIARATSKASSNSRFIYRFLTSQWWNS